MPHDSERPTLDLVRRSLAGILLLGLIGSGSELLLMEHTEDFLQIIPLILIGLSLIALVWVGWGKSGIRRRVFQGLMLLCIMSGVAGSLLHYRGNTEFEIEMSPALQGFDLFKQAITGATPTLAPGTMMVLGALGLLYTLPQFHPTTTHEDS